MEHVRERIEKGIVMPLLIWDPEDKIIFAVLCAEGSDYPLKRVFEITVAGGEMISEWGHVYPAIKDIARAMGYDQIDIVGRRGWGKFIPGAIDVSTQYTEDLGNG
jgi:hypothetical protein